MIGPTGPTERGVVVGGVVGVGARSGSTAVLPIVLHVIPGPIVVIPTLVPVRRYA